MKKTLLKITLLLIAAITAGSVNATVYNFYEDITDETKATAGEDVTVATYSHSKLKYVKDATTITYDNKFAVGYRIGVGTVTVSDNYVFRDKNEYQGLQIKWSNRTFAILGVTNGQRIKITVTHGGLSFVGQPALKNVAADAAVSDLYYTVSTDAASVDILMKATADGTYVKSVEIQDATTTETVTVGVAGYSNTYNFKDATAIAIDATEGSTSKVRNMFDGKFSITAKYTDLQLNSDYGFKVLYAGKPITIKSLTKGETITFTFTNGESSTGFKISGTSILEGLNDGDALASGTPYNVTASGDLIITNETKNPTIQSIAIAKAEQNIGGATLVSSNGLDFTDLPVEAYVATSADKGTVTFTKVNKVPANTPLYLKAKSVVSEDIPVITDGFETITTNLLKGSASSTTPLQSTGDTRYYVFGVKDTEPGFYPVSDSNTFTSAAGKAYLQLTAAQAAHARAIGMNFVFDDAPTGIATVKQAKADNVYYTLSGQRVANPTKGLYIVNGRKVIK